MKFMILIFQQHTHTIVASTTGTCRRRQCFLPIFPLLLFSAVLFHTTTTK